MWDDDDQGAAPGPADGLLPPWEATRSAWGWIEWTADRPAPQRREPIGTVNVGIEVTVEDDPTDPPPFASRFRIVKANGAALAPALGGLLHDRTEDGRASVHRSEAIT